MQLEEKRDLDLNQLDANFEGKKSGIFAIQEESTSSEGRSLAADALNNIDHNLNSQSRRSDSAFCEYMMIRTKEIDYLDSPCIAIYFQNMTTHVE